jgi:predicted glycoside hydrolase/deacetylase ChbG (UPF0249 family)
MPKSRTNSLLGYPDDARLLIINADDFGMYRDINEGILRTFAAGTVRSMSLMTPCAGAAQAMQSLADHPEIPFGVHLSIIRDLPDYVWGPLSPKEKIPSLLDENGHFYTLDRMSDLMARATLGDVETEFRAQIATVLAAGLKPTHLDWHCLHNGGRDDILDLTVGLAKENGLVVRIADHPLTAKLQAQNLPTLEYPLLDSFALELRDKSARYVQMLRELPIGLTEWAVHPSIGEPESQAMDDGWQVRKSDYDFLMSPEAREVIAQEGIVLFDYRVLQRVWYAV